MSLLSRRHFLLSAPTLALLAHARHALAAGKWVLLGERSVSDRLDHDSISVSAARGEFEAVQVRVRQHAVQFREMKIHFANGRTQEVALRQVIPAGGESRAIDLDGHDRVIRRIEFWYDAETRGRGRGARVLVYGRH
jgi:hypothetical protein